MRRSGALTVLGILAAAGCGSTTSDSGLMLVMRTDLSLPAPVQVVGVYVQRIDGTTTTTVQDIEVDAVSLRDGSKRLPGTLAIQSDGNAGTQIRVRVVAYDENRTPLVMREARVQVPTVGLKALPLPLLWMNTGDVADANPAAGGPNVLDPAAGQVQATSVDAFGRLRSDFCGDGETLDDRGACAPIVIALDSLVDFVATPARSGDEATVAAPSDTAAGGPAFCGPDQTVSCFDLVHCFDAAADPGYATVEIPATAIQGLDGASCFIDLGPIATDAGGVSASLAPALAIRADAASGALCTQDGSCLIPLDDASGAVFHHDTGRVDLPPGICRKAKLGKVAAVLASPLCARKPAALETCLDASGVAVGTGGCVDGTGWDGQRTAPVIAETCTSIPNATGFWIDRAGEINLVTSDAQFSTYPGWQGDECFLATADAATPVPTTSDAVVPTAAYKLLGGWNAANDTAFAFLGTPTDVLLNTAGVYYRATATSAADLRPVLNGNILFSAGAFFDVGSTGPAAAFLSSNQVFNAIGLDPTIQPVNVTASAPSFVSTTNSVTLADQGSPSLLQVIGTAEGKLEPLTCTGFTVSSGPTCVEGPWYAEGSDASGVTPYRAIALAKGVTGTHFVLANGPAGPAILSYDEAQLTWGLGAPPSFGVDAGLGVPPEMTLALAGRGGAEHLYFATANALVHASRPSSGVGFDFETLEAGTSYHAVQVDQPGTTLYWLQQNGAAGSVLKRRALGPDGAPL